MLENGSIRLVPADVSLAGQLVDYYQRNRAFLKAFEPVRDEAFFSLGHQREILAQEMRAHEEGSAFRYYITLTEQPQRIVGTIGLNNVIWGAFRSAFLGYRLDGALINKGYMSMAVGMLTDHAFEMSRLHRIEANVMPRNKASLRVLEKNHFVNEGISRAYLCIDWVWEDHIHMVKINDAMH